MTTLRQATIELPAALRGEPNPLPAFRVADPNGRVTSDPSVPPADRARLGWETAFRALPYPMLDGYTLNRPVRKLTSVVLENEHLTATVLPEWGGRLWSLVHRDSGRELLHRNPVLALGNLALCDAWFAGGVEWNLPQLGHQPLTASPLFAAEITGTEGEPALRLYEFERMKRLLWHVDLHLPPGSPCLFAHVRIINLNAHEVPMYWWTNIAVPETPDTRVLVPATGVLTHRPDGKLGLVDLPEVEGVDISYAARAPRAMEGYFHLDEGRHWIAALDGKGTGFFQTSTARLRGRKIFAWGQDPSGRHWQERLSGPGSAYLEIQAGLCRTQLESIPMPAQAIWSWTEAFGLLEADPTPVHGKDWSVARTAVATALEATIPEATVEAWDMKFETTRDHPPVRILSTGSGWGALELARMGQAATSDPRLTGFSFPETTLGPDHAPWLGLLRNGMLPSSAEPSMSDASMVQPEWESLLVASLSRPGGRTWRSLLHLGVMRLEHGDPAGAHEAWDESVALLPNCWAYRNLAQLETREKRHEQALALLTRAWPLTPDAAKPAIAREYLECALAANSPSEARQFGAALSADIQARDRIRLLRAKAALAADSLDEATALLDRPFADIREGDASPARLWAEISVRKLAVREGVQIDDALRARARREFPPPAHLRFGSSDSSAAYGQ